MRVTRAVRNSLSYPRVSGSTYRRKRAPCQLSHYIHIDYTSPVSDGRRLLIFRVMFVVKNHPGEMNSQQTAPAATKSPVVQILRSLPFFFFFFSIVIIRALVCNSAMTTIN